MTEAMAVGRALVVVVGLPRLRLVEGPAAIEVGEPAGDRPRWRTWWPLPVDARGGHVDLFA